MMATKKTILAPQQLHLYEGKEVVTTQKLGSYIIKGMHTVRISMKQKPIIKYITCTVVLRATSSRKSC
jgi:hypothetical protein